MSVPFDLETWLQARRADVNGLLERNLALPPAGEDPGRLAEAMRYSLLAPGKRLRPVLAMAASEAVGATLTEPVRLAATTVELVHCYSLIHDDLPCMDDDDYRRGKPTSHKVFGEATAILAGDALLTLAFEWIADAGLMARTAALETDGSNGNSGDYLRATAALARGAGMWGMVRGQARDLGESFPDTLDGLEILHREKTGALFRAALEIGGAVAGATSKELSALGRYADCFGVAFQHADDLSDQDHPNFSEAARARLLTLTADAVSALDPFGEKANPLRLLAQGLGQAGR